MGRLIPGPYSTNKNLTGTCAENITDTFNYSARAGSADSGPCALLIDAAARSPAAVASSMRELGLQIQHISLAFRLEHWVVCLG